MFDWTFYYLCVFGVCSTWHLSFIHSTFITVCYDTLIEFVLGKWILTKQLSHLYYFVNASYSYRFIVTFLRVIFIKHWHSISKFSTAHHSGMKHPTQDKVQRKYYQTGVSSTYLYGIHCKVWTITDYHKAIIKWPFIFLISASFPYACLCFSVFPQLQLENKICWSISWGS